MIQLSDLPEFKRIGKKMRKLAKKNGWKVRDVKLLRGPYASTSRKESPAKEAKFKSADLRGYPECVEERTSEKDEQDA